MFTNKRKNPAKRPFPKAPNIDSALSNPKYVPTIKHQIARILPQTFGVSFSKSLNSALKNGKAKRVKRKEASPIN